MLITDSEQKKNKTKQEGVKILFYVEPHPLRDSFVSHISIYKEFCKTCFEIYKSKKEEFKNVEARIFVNHVLANICLLYTSPSPRDLSTSRMPSSA